VPVFSIIGKTNGYRLSLIYTSRFGHLALNTHLFFIRHKIALLDENKKYFLIAPSLDSEDIVNNDLLLMFIRHSKEVNNVTIICSSLLYYLLSYFKNILIDNNIFYELEMNSNEYEFSLGVETISFNDKQLDYGNKVLKKMLINERKIVTIFARDSSYLAAINPNIDWSYHNYRDCDINTYIDSIKYLIKKGYVVVRVGSEFSDSLEFSDENYIEYCSSRHKSEFMDLFLIYISDFMFGSTSGATDISVLFNTPFLGINYAPFMESPLGERDLFIQKKLVDSENNIVNFREIVSKNPYHLHNGNKMMSNFGLRYIDNNSCEILDAVIEMEKKISKNNTLNAQQQTMIDRYHNEYCSSNTWSSRNSPISIGWLKKNYNLYIDDN
jgi:putative glycosyltransferase (TIGR04372 family)